ncbi:MAG TPA: DUF1461 domain-containing protein [Gemmatimonadales bacterium]|nr:DUF1461 domain-containing protein [Gemmatimonadales bacterium]
MRLLVSAATAVSILGLAVLMLLTPFWTHAGLDASGATSTFATSDQPYSINDATVATLLFGGSFEGIGGGSFYSVDEASHLRDARLILYAFFALLLMSVVFLVARLTRRAGRESWNAVARGGLAVAIGVVVFGVVGFLAFDIAFELFHRILFPGGNWEFPASSNMLQLYPYGFWQLTAMALGLISIVGGVITWRAGRARERRLAA